MFKTNIDCGKSEVYYTLSQPRILRLGYQRQSILSGGYFHVFSNDNITNPIKKDNSSSNTDIGWYMEHLCSPISMSRNEDDDNNVDGFAMKIWDIIRDFNVQTFIISGFNNNLFLFMQNWFGSCWYISSGIKNMTPLLSPRIGYMFAK